jgi:response regulator RpfG family c-di-GMP phosphodiesterase
MRGELTPEAVTVTVVDDEPMAQDVLVRAARAWHYQCQAANSAEQALQLLEKQLTPIVVTDLRMPGRGGVWLVHEIRRRWPEVNIIVLTAGNDPDAAEECLRAGAHHYFFKPIKLDEFRHVLETTARDYHYQQENRRYRAHLEHTVRRQTRRIRKTFLSAIESLVRSMEERDAYTAGHSRRVSFYASRLAAALNLEERLCKQLRLAAKMHDIGKIGVPEAILNKPASLTPDEERIIREHPVISERILKTIVSNPAILAGIRGHHERYDGKGYPDGLSGDRIPLLARLITIPDCFDAMTTSRAYRAALPLARAQEILAAGAGTQFDPAFVNVFLQLIPELTSHPLSAHT